MKEAPPRPPRLRRLSDEEIALWTEVARGVTRRRGAVLPTPSKLVAEPAPSAPPTAAEAPARQPAKPVPRRRSRRSNGG